MLLSLHLTDFVIVDRLDLDLGPGFNVLSGETGAGKSILIDALNLALGGRADASVVREGCARADITAVFRCSSRLENWLIDHDLQGDDNVVQLRRVVDKDGKSRAFINGRPSTAALQRELGDSLLEVHGQHANQALLKSEGQRGLLDSYANLAPSLEQLKLAWTEWQSTHQQWQRAQDQGRELALERDRLHWQLQDLDSIKPVDQEWEQLSEEQKRLEHSQSLLQAADDAAQQIALEDQSMVSRLQKITTRLTAMAQIDASLAPMVALIDEATIQLADAGDSLAQYAGRSDLDPQRAANVEERVSTLHAAARKYRLPAGQLPSFYAQLKEQWQTLEQAQDLAGLQARIQEQEKAYFTIAEKIAKARTKAAASLGKDISKTIQGLGMEGGSVTIALYESVPGPHGTQSVEFLVKAHSAGSAKPLGKVASGGELSRVSLGIAVAAAKANPTPTLIFDEADAGVGGAVAEKIGQLMRDLGNDRQVLAVTHLPQVAALGHQHYRVSKIVSAATRNSNGQVISDVHRLDRTERVEEIARMLGGVEITSTTRQHATEMLATDGA